MLSRVTRRSFLGLTTLLVGACQQQPPPRSMHDLVLLKREGCVHANEMRDRLNAALQTLRWPRDYQILDAGTLSIDDHRHAYPSPTVLYKYRDIFGMTDHGLSN